MLRSGCVRAWWMRSVGFGCVLVLPLLAMGCGDSAEDMSAGALNAAQNAYEIYGVYENDGPGAALEPDTYTPPDDPIDIAESESPRAARYESAQSDTPAVIPPPPPLMEDEFIDPFSTVEEEEAEEASEASEASADSASGDAPSEEEAEPQGDPEEGLLTRAKYNRVLEGMAYAEALEILGVGSSVISTSGDNDEVVMYRFSDDRGANFMARFEDDALTRKTNLHLPEPEEEAAEAETPEAENGEDNGLPQVGARQRPRPAPRPAPRPTRDAEPEAAEEGEAEDVDEAVEQEEDTEDPVEETPVPVEADGDQEQQDGEDWEAQQQQQQQEQGDFVEEEYYEEPYYEEAYVEQQPQEQAQLPGFRRSLRRGIHNLQLSNPTNSAVEVGVRSGTQGQNVRLSPGGSQTLRLDSGSYEVYYIFNALPHQLFGGGSVSLESYGMPDAEVILLEGGFNVQGFDPMQR